MELANADPIKLKSPAELAQDFARLQLVRKEREEAERKREEEKKGAFYLCCCSHYLIVTGTISRIHPKLAVRRAVPGLS